MAMLRWNALVARPLVYVLGAPDPEMTLIERILRVVGVTTIPLPVHPGNAYVADIGEALRSANAAIPVSGQGLVLVECADECLALPDAIRVDHHRPGDHGYGRPPTEAVAASSVGQVMRLLNLDVCRRCGDFLAWADQSGEEGAPMLSVGDDGRAGLSWPCGDLHDWPLDPAMYAEIRLASAADHCLAAAYRGDVPGVDPAVLSRWRAATRAAHQGRPIAEILRDVEAARLALRRAPQVDLALSILVADMRPGRGAVCGAHGAACLGSGRECWGDIPELPEAAAQEGLPFIALPRPGGKLVLQAAPPHAIEAFLVAWGHVHLTNLYGDPARGFAGGYLRDRA